MMSCATSIIGRLDANACPWMTRRASSAETSICASTTPDAWWTSLREYALTASLSSPPDRAQRATQDVPADDLGHRTGLLGLRVAEIDRFGGVEIDGAEAKRTDRERESEDRAHPVVDDRLGEGRPPRGSGRPDGGHEHRVCRTHRIPARTFAEIELQLVETSGDCRRVAAIVSLPRTWPIVDTAAPPMAKTDRNASQ